MTSTDEFTQRFLDFSGLRTSSSKDLTTAHLADIEDPLSQLLDFGELPEAPWSVPLPVPTQLHSIAPSQNRLSSWVSLLIDLVERIRIDLQTHISRLHTLNPSRRASIAQHLDRLASIQPQITGNSLQLLEDPLKNWTDSPRNAAQDAALLTYFEEVALIALGQAILLKNWSDRGIRPWNPVDLGRLNWALGTALKPHVPLDREGWQIIRPNLYSWYNFGPEIQVEVWTALESLKTDEEGPEILSHLLGPVRRAKTEIFEPQGYDIRFFKSLWNIMDIQGAFDTQNDPHRKSKMVFSPTLRDGALMRTSPTPLRWVGLEASAFQLMMAELAYVWSGPQAPPYWSVGSGLEVHARDQLPLALNTPKPNLLCRIAEMEACDFAFVLEEQTIRAQGRHFCSARFREQIEQLPYFKKIRSSSSTLGDLQTCVALTKLRPGGLLWWAREEPISTKDGHEMLHFLLDRAKLIAEWDFSEVEYSLPGLLPLFPRHLYLFEKEPKTETRLAHRPVRHSIQGHIRSHIELPLFLEDAFSPLLSATFEVSPRGQWSVLSHTSTTAQQEWLEKWPDPMLQSKIRELETLRKASLPFAHYATIRTISESQTSSEGSEAWNIPETFQGFGLEVEHSPEGRRLRAHALPIDPERVKGPGFLVSLPDERWIIPLKTYLVSSLVQQWLEYHAERRGEKWLLKEQVLKWIPIPKILLQILEVPGPYEHEPEYADCSLSPQWNALLTDLRHQPSTARDALQEMPSPSPFARWIHAHVFVATARAFDAFQKEHHRLFSLVTPSGKICWSELLKVLPATESIPLTIHPRIRLSGSLPSHLPIQKIDRVKSPSPGILFSTESGFNLHLSSENPWVINLIFEQLEGLSHPTWSELVEYLRLPRKLELAESTALDVLRMHEEQTQKLKLFQDLLELSLNGIQSFR